MTSKHVETLEKEGRVEGRLSDVKEKEGERGQLEKAKHRPNQKAWNDKNDEFVV